MGKWLDKKRDENGGRTQFGNFFVDAGDLAVEYLLVKGLYEQAKNVSDEVQRITDDPGEWLQSKKNPDEVLEFVHNVTSNLPFGGFILGTALKQVPDLWETLPADALAGLWDITDWEANWEALFGVPAPWPKGTVAAYADGTCPREYTKDSANNWCTPGSKKYPRRCAVDCTSFPPGMCLAPGCEGYSYTAYQATTVNDTTIKPPVTVDDVGNAQNFLGNIGDFVKQAGQDAAQKVSNNQPVTVDDVVQNSTREQLDRFRAICCMK